MSAESLAKARAVKAAKRAASLAPKPTTMSIDGPEESPVMFERPTNRPEPARAPRAQQLGRGEVFGRNGEVLSRTSNVENPDEFFIPKGVQPAGWDWQWNAISVNGSKEIMQNANFKFHNDGWRPVMAENYPGKLAPREYAGPVMRGSQILMERPAQLSEQARQEEIQKARRQISDRDESFTGVTKNTAFSMSNKFKGAGGSIKMSIDQNNDAPFPSHQVISGDD